jgi:hypothetical protein
MKSLASIRTTVIITCVTISLAGCSKSPKTTIENFYDAVAHGEITEAKSYLSAQIVGMMGDTKLSATLSGESEKIQACGGIKNIEINMQGEGEIRSGATTITFSGECAAKTEKTKLIKEDGDWKITASK